MNLNKTVLLIGNCGAGKTWVMSEIIEHKELTIKGKFGLFKFRTNKENSICVLGKYDGSTFQGSDKLSMAIAKDFERFKKFSDKKNWLILAEGDRFMNKRFISVFNPYIIKINDDGKRGRKIRQSKQTDRHLKAISTRVKNITPSIELENSEEALSFIVKLTFK